MLRLIAASLVIYGHCWAIANVPDGETDRISRLTGVFTGTLAVDVFFFVSGFLVTMSWVRRSSLWVFARNRLLRIMPALIVCVLFCAFVLGPLVTTASWHAYFSDRQPYVFARGNILMHPLQERLPGVFEANHYPATVNGSLWTLPAEVQMYAYVALFGALGLLRRKAAFTAGVAILVVFAVVAHGRIGVVTSPKFEGFAAFFCAGAFCWMFRDVVPVSGRLFLTLIGLCVVTQGVSAYPLLLAATVAYACVWFVYVPDLRWSRGLGDYSYGIYLYGFPMQQLVAWRFPAAGPWTLFVTSFPLACALAVASWHLCEKPALRLK